MKKYRELGLREYFTRPAKGSSNKKKGIRTDQSRMVFPKKKKNACKLMSIHQIRRSLARTAMVEKAYGCIVAFPPIKLF